MTSTKAKELTTFPDFVPDNWVWDQQTCPNEVQLSSNQKESYFFVDPEIQSTNTVAVRGCLGFAEGEHYWEVVFLEPPSGHSVMVGVGTVNTALHLDQTTDLLGKDSESWGLSYKGKIHHSGNARKYCEPFFAQNTIIGLHLDLSQGHLTFYKNGECLGLAFTGLKASRQRRLYPMISSTASETELGVGKKIRQLSQPPLLQRECMGKIRQALLSAKDVERLPLPRILRRCLEEL